jgi:hypothetical protein
MPEHIVRKLPATVKRRARGLLDMLYKPSELAFELALPVSRIYALILAGLPHQRDDMGRMWIPGPQAARWILNWHKPHHPIGTDQAFCLTCKKAVALLNPKRIECRGIVRLKSICPQCGCLVYRSVKRNDPSR